MPALLRVRGSGVALPEKIFDRAEPGLQTSERLLLFARGRRDHRRRALKQLKPDFVEVLSPHPLTLFPLMQLRGAKVVILWDEPEFLKPRPPLRTLYLRVFSRWLLRRSDFDLTSTLRLQEQMLMKQE